MSCNQNIHEKPQIANSKSIKECYKYIHYLTTAVIIITMIIICLSTYIPADKQNETSQPDNDNVTQAQNDNAANDDYENDIIVYWAENGEVWHTTPDCPTLSRTMNILHGTIQQSGKSRVCKICGDGVIASGGMSSSSSASGVGSSGGSGSGGGHSSSSSYGNSHNSSYSGNYGNGSWNNLDVSEIFNWIVVITFGVIVICITLYAIYIEYIKDTIRRLTKKGREQLRQEKLEEARQAAEREAVRQQAEAERKLKAERAEHERIARAEQANKNELERKERYERIEVARKLKAEQDEKDRLVKIKNDRIAMLKSIKDNIMMIFAEIDHTSNAISAYESETHDINSLIPPDSELTSSGLPTMKNISDGTYGYKYTVYVTRCGTHFHTSRCRYAKYGSKYNLFDMEYNKYSYRHYTPCDVCGSYRMEANIEWMYKIEQAKKDQQTYNENIKKLKWLSDKIKIAQENYDKLKSEIDAEETEPVK